jgi:hypothetical protein
MSKGYGESALNSLAMLAKARWMRLLSAVTVIPSQFL